MATREELKELWLNYLKSPGAAEESFITLVGQFVGNTEKETTTPPPQLALSRSGRELHLLHADDIYGYMSAPYNSYWQVYDPQSIPEEVRVFFFTKENPADYSWCVRLRDATIEAFKSMGSIPNEFKRDSLTQLFCATFTLTLEQNGDDYIDEPDEVYETISLIETGHLLVSNCDIVWLSKEQCKWLGKDASRAKIEHAYNYWSRINRAEFVIPELLSPNLPNAGMDQVKLTGFAVKEMK